jgi:ADP-ribose pyrophosphatase YjhB (NUDIX family)
MNKENKIKIRLRLIIIQQNRILLYYSSISDTYFFIGGRLNYGETIKEGWERELKEELGEDTIFTFKKVLYIRDFIIPEENEHSLELFILGDVNKSDDVEGRPDPEYGGKKWPTWKFLDKLPENLYPKPLGKKILEDYRLGFPNEGEYVGRMN